MSRQQVITSLFSQQKSRSTSLKRKFENISSGANGSAETSKKLKSVLSDQNAIAKVVATSPKPTAPKLQNISDTLKLPVTYQTLLNQFVAADRCLCAMESCNETVTFSKLKHAVEDATKRPFTEQMLRQIVYVYPNCFKLDYCQTDYNSSKTKLVIRADCMAGVDKEDVQLSLQDHLTAALMTKRAAIFRQSLLKIVFQSHLDFLKSLSPELTVRLDASKLQRWHPNFLLETATPVIPTAQLPCRPNGGTRRHSKAKDILVKNAKSCPDFAKFVEASQQVLEETVSVATTSKINSLMLVKPGPLSSVSHDLVAEVIEGKKHCKLLASTKDPVADESRIRRDRLPRLIRIIRGLFFHQTRSVSLKNLLAAVKHSWPSPISEEEVRATFDLLIEKEPEWIQILKVSISPDPLFQIESGADINNLIANLAC